MSRLLRNIFMFVVYAYLYIPIIILVTNSFNEDRYGKALAGTGTSVFSITTRLSKQRYTL